MSPHWSRVLMGSLPNPVIREGTMASGPERKFSGQSEAQSEGYGSEEGLEAGEISIPREEMIFVNRNLNLAKITCYGFDMDYTLCEYMSPQFDDLAFGLAKEWLVDNLGYTRDILDITYDPNFGVRGLWFDRVTGNLLKTDQFGKILNCWHGFKSLKDYEIKAVYPGKIQRRDEKRVFIMNTLFNMAETFLVAALIDFLDKQEETKTISSGWILKSGEHLTFAKLFLDLRTAIDDIHLTSLALKKSVLADMQRYVRKDPRLAELLMRIKASGKKSFLLTNSDWWYTQQVMTYLLGSHWTAYFDLVGVDAGKPRFFSSGSPLCLVATQEPGAPKVGLGTEPAPRGPTVYSGGDHTVYAGLLQARGPDIVYVGDHLFADVIKCRKQCEWRTVLIVPELTHELRVSHSQSELLDQLGSLEMLLSGTGTVGELKARLWEVVNGINRSYGVTGSLFRSGSRLSYFGSQVGIWADVYTGSVCNLSGYSLDHRFFRPGSRLPHEEGHRPGVEGTMGDQQEDIHRSWEELGDIQEAGEDDDNTANTQTNKQINTPNACAEEVKDVNEQNLLEDNNQKQPVTVGAT